jgi:hypothetical protein
MTPVARPTPAEPKCCVAAYVATEAAPMFATLLPIRIVMRRRSGLALRRTSAFAPRLPSSASDRARVWEMEKKAISALEKKPDSARRRTSRRAVPIIGAAEFAVDQLSWGLPMRVV